MKPLRSQIIIMGIAPHRKMRGFLLPLFGDFLTISFVSVSVSVRHPRSPPMWGWAVRDVVEIEGFARNGGGIRDYQNLNHEKSLQGVIWWLKLKVLLGTVVESGIIKISTTAGEGKPLRYTVIMKTAIGTDCEIDNEQ